MTLHAGLIAIRRERFASLVFDVAGHAVGRTRFVVGDEMRLVRLMNRTVMTFDASRIGDGERNTLQHRAAAGIFAGVALRAVVLPLPMRAAQRPRVVHARLLGQPVNDRPDQRNRKAGERRYESRTAKRMRSPNVKPIDVGGADFG